MPSDYGHQTRTSLYEPWDGQIRDLPCIGNGVSGLVFAVDEQRVAKISFGTPRSSEAIEIERCAYRRFNRTQRKRNCIEYWHILKCLETDNPRGLVFARCKDTVRIRLQTSNPTHVQKLQWAIEAAQGLSFAHECEVIQGDGGDDPSLRNEKMSP